MSIYGDISPRTAAKVIKDLLPRAHHVMVLEKFGVPTTLPANSTKTVAFRRYNALPNTPVPLTEGIQPTGSPLTVTDVTLTLTQYGNFVPFTDVIADTHEDPVLQTLTSDLIPQQAAETIERVRYGALQACTNVFYGGGVASRSLVAATIDLNLIRKIVRALKRQNAAKITKVVKASINIGTEPVNAAYVCVIHPDLEPALRALNSTTPGAFVPVEKYAGITPFESEIGKVEEVRFVSSTLAMPYASAGAAPGSNWVTSGSNKADVYPLLFLGANAYGIVALKGQYSAQVLVSNPKPQAGDALAQTGTVGWKTMQGAIILNDLWMAVAEVAAPAL